MALVGVLPTSRLRTYDGSTPVASTDLNAIQDAIIGGKYKEQELVLGPAAFVALGGVGADGLGLGGVSWTHVANQFVMYASVPVPVGSRITRVKFFYDRKNVGSVGLALKKIAAGVGSAIVTFSDNASGSGFSTHEITAINYTVQTVEPIQVEITIDPTSAAAGGKVIGASIFHDRL